MHELTIAQELMEIIESEQKDRGFAKVISVHLRFGALSCVNPDALRFSFEVITKDNLADGADMQIDMEPMQYLCRNCDHVASGPEVFICPKCNSNNIMIKANHQMEIISLEVE